MELQPGPSGLQRAEPQPGPSGLGKRPRTPTYNRPLKQARLGISTTDSTSEWNIRKYATDEDVTRDEDNGMSFFYDLRPVKSTFIRKFNTHREDHQAFFKNMNTITPEQFPIQVHRIIEDIFDKLVGSSKTGKIRVAMDADGLAHAYNSPFVNAEDFDPMRIIKNIAKILNSNESLVLAGNEIRLNIIRVDMPPKGAGRHEHLNNRRIMDAAQGCCRNTVW